MNRSAPWAAIGGIVFVVMMVVGSRLISDVPAPNAPDRDITLYLTDSAKHMRNMVGAYLWMVGALAFLLFLTGLQTDLRRAEGGTGALSNLTFGAGVAFTAVWMVSAAAFASVAYAVWVRQAPLSGTDWVRVLPPMGRLLLLHGGGFTGILVLLASSAVILRTGVYAGWLGWLGIVAAIGLLFDILYLTILPFWGWVFLVSVVRLLSKE